MVQGDNLNDAQAFSGLCDVTLSRLVESESYIVNTKDEKIYVLSALDTIQLEAKRMQARAISRAARTAMEGVESLRDTKCQVRNLRDLMHLVRQYQSGLEEITSHNQQAEPVVKLSHDEHTNFETARTTLKSVIKHAGADRDIAALSRLVQWRPDSQDEMTFDHLMPALSEEILRTARTFKKSVSVSYAADDNVMGPNLYHELSDAVTNVAVWLVAHAIKSPEHRLGQGLGRSAHIAVTARTVEGRMNVLLSCDGELSGNHAPNLPDISNVFAFGGSLDCETLDDIVRIEIKGLRVSDSNEKTSPFSKRVAQKAAEHMA